MEDLIKEISAAQIAIVGATSISIVYMIKEFFSVLSKWVSKEIMFKQELKHDRLKVTHDIDIELQKQEKKNQLLIQKSKLHAQLNKSTSSDVNKVIDILDDIKNTFKLQRTLIMGYHNGIQKGFRNFSTRYERHRDGTISIKADFQSKPLADYHKEISRFNKERCIFYDIADEHTDENSHILTQMSMLNVKLRVVVPLVVPIDNINVPEEHRIIVVGDNSDYYLIGVFVAHFDSESYYIDRKQTEIMLRNKVDDIINIYEKNPNVLV